MRIKILTSLPHADLQAISFLGLLKEKWDNNDITIVTDGYYDFLHVIGLPTSSVIRHLQQERERLIPIAYSPLGTIAPWSKIPIPTTITWLKNPVTTTDLTAADFASAIQRFYQEVLEHHEDFIWSLIRQRIGLLHLKEEQPELFQVLQQILYVEYKFKRKQILSSNIEELGHLMHEMKYDEDELANGLQALHTYDFMASLEQVMEERKLLSEGFMPIPALQNRITKKINKTII